MSASTCARVMPPDHPATSVRAATEVVARGGGGEAGLRELACEVAVNVVYGGLSYAVMMMSPSDLEDFAVGFSLTEGVVKAVGEIRGMRVDTIPDGLRLAVDIAPERLHAHLARRRAMSGRTGCGLCGIEDLAALRRVPSRVADAPPITVQAVYRAIDGLERHQPLNALTRAVHAAAWADRTGEVRLVREDVGRHNALDKAIGALVRDGVDPASGFLVITSRCSFEMVEKAVAFGAATLVAISAPTSLALQRACAHGLTLVAVARSDSVTVFSGGLAGRSTRVGRHGDPMCGSRSRDLDE